MLLWLLSKFRCQCFASAGVPPPPPPAAALVCAVVGVLVVTDAAGRSGLFDLCFCLSTNSQMLTDFGT